MVFKIFQAFVLTLFLSISFYNTVGICLLFISSAVTISVPFALGKVIDIIYTSSQGEGGNMMEKLRRLCGILTVVFICGALANFGRVYLMNTSGKEEYLSSDM